MGLDGSAKYERQDLRENYEVLDLLSDITRIARVSGGIPNNQIVHVGGIAPMLHACFSTDESRYSIAWRGTADLDIAITVDNGAERLADALGGAGMKIVQRRNSTSIAHKHAIEIELGTGKGLFPMGRIFELDVYGGDAQGVAKINDRTLHPYPGRFITEQVVSHTCHRSPIKYTVPSLVDTLILKMDVAIETERPKDTIDISSLLFSAEKYGIDPDKLVRSLKKGYTVLGVTSPLWTSKVAPALKRVCGESGDLIPHDYVPVASQNYLNEITKLINKCLGS